MVLPTLLHTIFRRRTLSTAELFPNSGVFEIDFDTIRVATNELSLCISPKGRDPFYKGKLPNGQEIAVRDTFDTLWVHGEICNEVNVLTKLRHKNLVHLLGYCSKPNKIYLVYEFTSNSSLDQFIYDPLTGSELTWEICRNIIGGIARGIRYLHEECGLGIIHHDIDPINILLDAKMEPKIASFRWAEMTQEGQAVSQSTYSHSTSTPYRGYKEREYYRTERASFRSDVYSFGVLILAIISRRKAYTDDQGPLVDYVRECCNTGEAINVIHEVMRENEKQDSIIEILRYIHIALRCVDENVEIRPSIDQVLHWFSCSSTPLPESTTMGTYPVEADSNRSLSPSLS